MARPGQSPGGRARPGIPWLDREQNVDARESPAARAQRSRLQSLVGHTPGRRAGGALRYAHHSRRRPPDEVSLSHHLPRDPRPRHHRSRRERAAAQARRPDRARLGAGARSDLGAGHRAHGVGRDQPARQRLADRDQRQARVRAVARHRGAHARQWRHLEGRAPLYLQAAPGREVARRGAVHLRRRGLHPDRAAQSRRRRARARGLEQDRAASRRPTTPR